MGQKSSSTQNLPGNRGPMGQQSTWQQSPQHKPKTPTYGGGMGMQT